MALTGHLGRRTPETIISDTKKLMRKQNPQAAEFFDSLDEERDKLAVASQIRYAQGKGPRSSLDWLAAQYESGRLDTRKRLLKMTLDRRNELLNDDERSGFLVGYESLTGGLALMPDKAENEYLDLLEQLQGTADWNVVKDDPSSLVIRSFLAEKHPDLWSFYCSNREWLRVPLADIEASGDATAKMVLIRVIQAAKDYHPLVEESVRSLRFQVFGLLLFEEYGPLLKGLRDNQIPLDQALEAVFANQDDLPRSSASKQEVEDKVIELTTLRIRKPKLWTLVCEGSPDILWLDKVAPAHSEEVCLKYGHLDVAVMLRTFYQDDIRLAVNSLLRYGDVALYYLSEHAERPNSQLRNLIRKPDIGIRVIPYMAKFGDKGLAQLNNDVRWLNEWFDAEGNEIRPPGEWLKAVPFVGAPANVIDKLSHGRPLEAAEFGWAALDVADCALLIVSLGTSSAATAVRKSAEVAGTQIVKRTGRSAVRSAVLEAARSSAAAGTRFTRGPVLRGLINAAAAAVHVADKGRAAVRFAVTGVDKGLRAWKSVNPTLRRWAYRGLLGLSLVIVVRERTLPMLSDTDFGRLVGEYIGRTSVEIATNIATGVVSALRELLDVAVGRFPWEYIILGLIWLLFGVMICRVAITRHALRV